MSGLSFWEMLKRSFAEWNRHNAQRLGAALAFYTILSLAPMLVLVVAITGFVFSKATVQAEIVSRVSSMIGPSGADTVKSMLHSAQNPTAGIISSIIGIVVLLFGASGVLVALRSTLDIIWGVESAESSGGLMGMIRERLASFAMVLGLGFLLLLSFAVSTFLGAVGNTLPGYCLYPNPCCTPSILL